MVAKLADTLKHNFFERDKSFAARQLLFAASYSLTGFILPALAFRHGFNNSINIACQVFGLYRPQY